MTGPTRYPHDRIRQRLTASGYTWRTVPALAHELALDYATTVSLLYADSGVVFARRQKDGCLLARLADAAAPVTDIQLFQHAVAADGVLLPYAVHLPIGYSMDQEWPLIVFLHGSGEAGADGVRQVGAGLGPTIRRSPLRYPAIVVMPQIPSPGWWDQQLGGVGIPHLVWRAVDEVRARFSVDPNRLALTGISRGGHGCWVVAAHAPERVSAVLAIAAVAKSGVAHHLGRVPVRMFHGAADSAVYPSHSYQMERELIAVGNRDVRIEILAGREHAVWEDVYGSEQVAEWLITTRRTVN